MSKPGRLLTCVIICSLAAPFFCSAQGVFSVDGMAVDTLDASSPFADEPGYFEAELPSDMEDFEKYKEAEASAGESAARHREVITSAQQSIVQGDWETARRNIETALQNSPDNPYLLKKAALLYALAGEYKTADTYFGRYLRLKPDDVDSVAAWAAVALRAREWPKAEALLSRAFELSPRNLSAHFQAVVYRIAASRTSPLRPYDWNHLTLAEMHIIANWMEADRQAYEQLLGEKGFEQLITLTLGPVHVASLNEIRLAAQRAIAMKKRSQWQQLRDVLTRLQDLGVQSYWVPLGLARAQYGLGRTAESLEILRRVQQQHPRAADAWQNSAFVRIKFGDYEGGLADAREAQRLSPKNPEIEFTLIYALAGARKTDELWPALEGWARRNPKMFKSAMQGDDPLLQIIRDDPRYQNLLKALR